MTGNDKRLILIYEKMSTAEKYEAALKLSMIAEIKGNDLEMEFEPIRKAMTEFEGWKWSNIFGRDMCERAQYFELCWRKEKLANLETLLRSEWTFILSAKEKYITIEDRECLQKLIQVVPKVLKEEKLWKPEYEGMDESDVLKDALEKMDKQIANSPYSKKFDERAKDVIQIITNSNNENSD